MTLTRRELLRNSALTGAALAGGGLLTGLAPAAAAGRPAPAYGALLPDPAGMLDLPEGFRYRILQRGGDGWSSGFTTYDDGQKVAGDADGAASFGVGRGRTVLVLNHELSGSGEAHEAVPQVHAGRPVPTYDPAEVGGTSNIVLGPSGTVESIYPSLAGTKNNCAGGPTPWGTWLTCEESTGFSGERHGYVFEVDPAGERTDAVPYTGMGRFNHEAVAIDPRDSVAYLTEDRDRGLVYRYVPGDRSMEFGSLHRGGGTLAAMKVGDLLRLGQATTVGATFPVTWVTISDPDPDVDVISTDALNQQVSDAQVTRSRKLEGCWWSDADDRFWFVVSDERDSNRPLQLVAAEVSIAHQGQVWAYDPVTETAELVVHIPTGSSIFDSPDNICISPWGSAFLCEDGGGDNYVVGVDAVTGDLWAFARNRLPGTQEMAGANFSPDGKTLFVSVQNPSTTFAITGPWQAVRGGRR